MSKEVSVYWNILEYTGIINIRLGIVAEKVDIEKIRSLSEENGIVVNEALLEGDNSEEARIFRKRTLRSHSTSDEPPPKLCHLDENPCRGSTSNGQISPAFYSITKSS